MLSLFDGLHIWRMPEGFFHPKTYWFSFHLYLSYLTCSLCRKKEETSQSRYGVLQFSSRVPACSQLSLQGVRAITVEWVELQTHLANHRAQLWRVCWLLFIWFYSFGFIPYWHSHEFYLTLVLPDAQWDLLGELNKPRLASRKIPHFMYLV